MKALAIVVMISAIASATISGIAGNFPAMWWALTAAMMCVNFLLATR